MLFLFHYRACNLSIAFCFLINETKEDGSALLPNTPTTNYKNMFYTVINEVNLGPSLCKYVLMRNTYLSILSLLKYAETEFQ